MIVSSIVAVSKNGVIGKNNALPWHIPEDLADFKEKTMGKVLILGRKTYESFGSRPLPNRFHIVVSRNPEFREKIEQQQVQLKKENHPLEMTVVSTISDAFTYAKTLIPPYPQEVFIIGGSEIYESTIHWVDRVYMTLINKDFEGDAFFPPLDQEEFQLMKNTPLNTYPGASFQIYERVHSRR